MSPSRTVIVQSDATFKGRLHGDVKKQKNKTKKTMPLRKKSNFPKQTGNGTFCSGLLGHWHLRPKGGL